MDRNPFVPGALTERAHGRHQRLWRVRMEAFLTVRIRRTFQAHLVGLIFTAVTASAVVIPTAPASAQGLFDFLFGSPRRQGPPPSARSYADPSSGYERDGDGRSAGSGVSGVFCVRLCDGRYFPIQRGANPAQACNSFCPASQTKIFNGGSGIDSAVASDGTRYASLRNAFAYRERIVENCTCNGRDAYGLVTQNVAEDPTLRNGDIVATNDGFVAYTGSGRRAAEFTPIQSYPGLSGDLRERLAHTRITPSNATPISLESLREGAAALPQDSRGRSVQLER